MVKIHKLDDRLGWELIWRHGDSHPRYGSFAAPDASVVEWAETIPVQGAVLDLGCGVGRHTVYLGERGFRMAGVDIAPSGIRQTQQACAARQIAFEGCLGQISELAWADGTFDAALSIATIHHQLRQGIIQTLAEVWRVLKPGGLLLVDIPCTDTVEYNLTRSEVVAGRISEVERNTFVDERADLDDMDDSFLPHHYCDEMGVRDLLRSFEIIWLKTSLNMSKEGPARRAKWVASARRPCSD
jgi:SAM-dependent methyltransferase